jgi:hypothetical protein
MVHQLAMSVSAIVASITRHVAYPCDMNAKMSVALLVMMMLSSGHCLAAESWWVVGSFEKMAGGPVWE